MLRAADFAHGVGCKGHPSTRCRSSLHSGSSACELGHYVGCLTLAVSVASLCRVAAGFPPLSTSHSALAPPSAAMLATRGDGDSKRRAITQLLGLRGVSASTVQQIMGVLHGDGTRHDVRSTVDMASCSVLTRLPLEFQSGVSFGWPVMLLQDLLPHVIAHCEGFRDIFEQAVLRNPPSHSRPWRLIVYVDEITPGNPLRPDNQRKISAFYASFLEFQDFLRCEESWMVLGVLRSSVVKEIAGGMSAAIRQLLRSMLVGPRSLRTAGAVCGTMVVFAEFHRILGDEAAVKAAIAAKGASRLKPCIHCKNVVAKAVEGQPSLADCDSEGYIVDVACADPTRFDAMSDADWHNAHDMLQAIAVRGGPKSELEEAQKALGLRWEPRGLLADAALRRHVAVSKCVRDPMHVLLANGTMSTEIYLLLQAWRKCSKGFKLSELREYCARWSFPRARKQSKISDVFSDARVSASAAGNSIKGGASEMLSVYCVLRRYVETVIAPSGRIAHHRASFLALCEVIDGMLLLKHRFDPVYLRTFDAACARWVRLHVQCYANQFVRPKTHYMLHLSAQPRADKFWLDCFVHERKHQAIKAESEYIRNTQTYEQSVLKAVHLAQLQQQHTVLPSGLVGARAPCPMLAAAIGRPCEVANAMRCRFVPYGVGDVLFCADKAVQVSACVLAGSDLMCIVRMLALLERPSRTTSRWRITDALYLLDLDGGAPHRHALCWCEEDGGLTVLGP